MTTTISAELEGSLACSISACRLVPGTHTPECISGRGTRKFMITVPTKWDQSSYFTLQVRLEDSVAHLAACGPMNQQSRPPHVLESGKGPSQHPAGTPPAPPPGRS